MTKQELIEKLRVAAETQYGSDIGAIDHERAHMLSDALLVEYINDPEISQVWADVSDNFWYA